MFDIRNNQEISELQRIHSFVHWQNQHSYNSTSRIAEWETMDDITSDCAWNVGLVSHQQTGKYSFPQMFLRTIYFRYWLISLDVFMTTWDLALSITWKGMAGLWSNDSHIKSRRLVTDDMRLHGINKYDTIVQNMLICKTCSHQLHYSCIYNDTKALNVMLEFLLWNSTKFRWNIYF